MLCSFSYVYRILEAINFLKWGEKCVCVYIITFNLEIVTSYIFLGKIAIRLAKEKKNLVFVLDYLVHS